MAIGHIGCCIVETHLELTSRLFVNTEHRAPAVGSSRVKHRELEAPCDRPTPRETMLPYNGKPPFAVALPSAVPRQVIIQHLVAS